MSSAHGGDIYGLSGPVLDFSANQNPLGMPPEAAQAARDAVAQAERYPDPQCRILRRAIAALDGVLPEQVFCGAGAAELIYRLCYAQRPSRALVTAPTFSEYAGAVEAAGGEVLRHVLKAERAFDVDRSILAAIDGRADMVILCDPNNPTGRTIPAEVLEEILLLCREQEIRLVVDECFLRLRDGGGAGLAPRLEEFPNLVLLRAFTKSHAMPGLRLGYCLSADPDLPGRLDRSGPPWAVSQVAQAAGLAACARPDWPERAMELIRPERARLKGALEALGAQVWESAANYLLFRLPGAAGLKERMLARGVLIRACGDYPGLGADYYRVAVRLPRENGLLLDALGEVLS